MAFGGDEPRKIFDFVEKNPRCRTSKRLRIIQATEILEQLESTVLGK
jgi:hypothetical protein